MKTIIKIDSAFKWRMDDELLKILEHWWNIIDKTILGDRYIQYILSKTSDPDLWKTWNWKDN